MGDWPSNPTAAAWVQAVSAVVAVCVSIVTIVVAVWIPARQRSKSIEDAQKERTRQEKEHLRRLCAGLRAEVVAAQDVIKYREFSAGQVTKLVEEGEKRGAKVIGNTKITPGSMTISDAIVYRQLAAEIGRLPPELTKTIVKFYADAFEVSRLADGAPSTQQACDVITSLATRLKMGAVMLLKTLDKFEAADFLANANIRLTQNDIRQLAAETGYPLEQVAKERGLSLPN
jgi:hypothetical protein